MTKQMKCGDLMPGCGFVATGESEDDVLRKAAAHAKAEHGIEEITSELVEQVKGAIQNA